MLQVDNETKKLLNCCQFFKPPVVIPHNDLIAGAVLCLFRREIYSVNE
jgi:hypothetical protein